MISTIRYLLYRNYLGNREPISLLCVKNQTIKRYLCSLCSVALWDLHKYLEIYCGIHESLEFNDNLTLNCVYLKMFSLHEFHQQKGIVASGNCDWWGFKYWVELRTVSKYGLVWKSCLIGYILASVSFYDGLLNHKDADYCQYADVFFAMKSTVSF